MVKIVPNLPMLGNSLKLNTSIVDANLSFAVNFNYQVNSVCQQPTPPSTSTPTFDSELGIEIDTSTVTVIPDIPEHSFISCNGCGWWY